MLKMHVDHHRDVAMPLDEIATNCGLFDWSMIAGPGVTYSWLTRIVLAKLIASTILA